MGISNTTFNNCIFTQTACIPNVTMSIHMSQVQKQCSKSNFYIIFANQVIVSISQRSRHLPRYKEIIWYHYHQIKHDV